MEKTVILNQNRDFQLLYQRGKKIASPYAIIYLRKTRRKYNRLGITVGKKVGCAVKRSRARRVIRQAYRETEHLMPVGMDMVIVALPSIVGIRSTQLRDYLAGSGVPVYHVLVGGVVATIRYIPLRCFCKNVVLEQIFESTEVVYIPLTAYVNTLYRFETGKIYGYYAVWTKSRERACY